MLKPGRLVGTTLEAGSMARAIEDAMVDQGVIVPIEETPETANQRKKFYVALAIGIVSHLVANLEVEIQHTVQGSAGDVR